MERLLKPLSTSPDEHSAVNKAIEHSPTRTPPVCKHGAASASQTPRALPELHRPSGLFAPVRRGWRTYHDDHHQFLTGKNIFLKGTASS